MLEKKEYNKFCESFSKLYIGNIKETQLIIEALNTHIEHWNMQRYFTIEEEPPKFLKKKHLAWENKLNEINNKLFKLYNDLELTIKDLEELKAAIK